MTNREFYTAIVNACAIEPTEEEWEELKSFATEAIAKLDARNAKRASTMSQKQKDNEVIKESIREFLVDGGHFANEISTAVGFSTSKVSALCRQMVGDEILKSEDVKVKGKGTQKFYSLA